MPAQFRSLRVWLNAFIPGHVPGYTDELTKGPFAGRTVIYGMGDAPEAYLTDQRMFSASPDSPSQLHAEAAVDLVASPYRLSHREEADFAMPIGPSGEPEICERPVDLSRMTVELATARTLSSHREVAKAVGVLPLRPGASKDQIFLRFAGDVTPACSKMAAHFGDIHYDGVVMFDLARGTLDFVGHMHRFPAFEMYAALDETTPVAVFRLSPPRGSTALHQAGASVRTVKSSIALAPVVAR